MIKFFSILTVSLVTMFFFCNVSFAQRNVSKNPNPPEDTATEEGSAYTPDDKPKDKLDKSVRVTGPVWVNPLDEDKEKKDLEDYEMDDKLEDFDSEEGQEPMSQGYRE